MQDNETKRYKHLHLGQAPTFSAEIRSLPLGHLFATFWV